MKTIEEVAFEVSRRITAAQEVSILLVADDCGLTAKECSENMILQYMPDDWMVDGMIAKWRIKFSNDEYPMTEHELVLQWKAE